MYVYAVCAICVIVVYEFNRKNNILPTPHAYVVTPNQQKHQQQRAIQKLKQQASNMIIIANVIIVSVFCIERVIIVVKKMS